MRSAARYILFFCISFLVISMPAWQVLADPINLNSVGQKYKPAKVIEQKELYFPTSAKETLQEAYIDVKYDVDENGKAHNFLVSRTSGTDVFDKFLKLNIEDWKIEPATQDGNAIQQRNMDYTVVYYMYRPTNKNPELRMRPGFAKYYKRMRTALKTKDYEAFDKANVILSTRVLTNFAETRAYWLTMDAYYNRTGGSIHDRIMSLEKALAAFPLREKTKKLLNKVREQLFKLYVENGQYGKAYSLFHEISTSEFSEAQIMSIGKLFDEVEAKLISGDELNTEIRVEALEIIKHPLYRNQFSFSSEQLIEHAQLLCKDFNLVFTPQIDTLYQIPSDWQGCLLEIQSQPKSLISINELSTI